VKRDDNAVGYTSRCTTRTGCSFWCNDPGRLSVRRVDQSNTQVTVKVEVQSF
jgi:hypothetical protein